MNIYLLSLRCNKEETEVNGRLDEPDYKMQEMIVSKRLYGISTVQKIDLDRTERDIENSLRLKIVGVVYQHRPGTSSIFQVLLPK